MPVLASDVNGKPGMHKGHEVMICKCKCLVSKTRVCAHGKISFIFCFYLSPGNLGLTNMLSGNHIIQIAITCQYLPHVNREQADVVVDGRLIS